MTYVAEPSAVSYAAPAVSYAALSVSTYAAPVAPAMYGASTIIIDAFSGVASQVVKMSVKRAYFSLLAIQGTILAVGGVTDNGYTEAIEVFDQNSKSWTQQHVASFVGGALSR